MSVQTAALGQTLTLGITRRLIRVLWRDGG